MAKNILKTVAIMLCVLILGGLGLKGIDSVTAPIIEANGASAQFEPLFAVMPEASNFETLYTSADPASSTLVDVPETVTGIYQETGGLGYAITLSTTAGYTGEAIEFTIAVDGQGLISGVVLNAYPETKDFGAEYPGTYVGQDSALGGVSLVAGVTYSSRAFRDAVTDGFNALIANSLVGAGEKSDDQLLMELLPVHYSGIDNAGVPQYEETEVDQGSIVKAFKATNGSGFAFMLNDGSLNYLGVWTVVGGAKVVDLEGNAVDNSAMLEEISVYGLANCTDNSEREISRLQRLAGETAVIEPMSLELYSSVTGAYSITDGGTQYYGFVARSYAYNNEPMAVYYVLDQQGAIVAMTADEIIFHAEYFSAYTLDEPSYKAGFVGLTADTFTGEEALISGATLSSEGIRIATQDVFAAFAAIA